MRNQIKQTNKNILIITIKEWNKNAGKRFAEKNPCWNIKIVTNKNRFTYSMAKKFDPRYIFFLHWSWKIPERIYDNYECVVFHMTDLPFGRGGSPLQNLIVRGIYKSKITALKAGEKIDAGDIYLKRSLCLKSGSAEDIFQRALKIVFEKMIPYIIKNNPIPIPQTGRIVKFKRRVPDQSNIMRLKTRRKIYDYIRMLDAEGYPPAYIETSTLKVEFKKAELKDKYVTAVAKIKVKNEEKNNDSCGSSG